MINRILKRFYPPPPPSDIVRTEDQERGEDEMGRTG
jgi:hypothetical protein